MAARLITFEHFQAPIEHREKVVQARDLLRSLMPEHWQVVWQAHKLCEKIASRQKRIYVEEVVGVLASPQRRCCLLGPGAQETIEHCLSPVIERLGLDVAIAREVACPANRELPLWTVR